METETVSSGGAFGSQEAPEKTNSYYVNSCQNLTNPCNAAEYVQGYGIFLQAASATVNCSQPEERPRRTRGRRTTRKDHKRTTRDNEKGTRKEHTTMIGVVLTMMFFFIFCKDVLLLLCYV